METIMNTLKEWKEYCHFCKYHYSNFHTVSPNYSCMGSYLDLKEECVFRNKEIDANKLTTGIINANIILRQEE